MPVISPEEQVGFPFELEYSHEALERIRQLAVEGLLMLPRVGIGVGGLLLGLREGERIRILDSLEIPCLHANGPSFVLSSEETAHAVRLARASSPLPVVGWYCSKTRGPVNPNDADHTLFSALCPENWHMMILIKPSTIETSRFAVCFRDGSGNVVIGDERPLPVHMPTLVEAAPPNPPEPVLSVEPAPKPQFTVVPEPAAKTATAVRMAPEVKAFPAAAATTDAGQWIAERWVPDETSGSMTALWATIAIVLVAAAVALLLYSR